MSDARTSNPMTLVRALSIAIEGPYAVKLHVDSLDEARALQAHLSSLITAPPVETSGDRWISVSERLPDSGVKVLGFWHNELGKTRRTCVEYIAKFTRTAEDFSDDTPDDWFDCDHSGTSYVPEGWYERIETTDDRTFVAIPVEQWRALPAPPEKSEAPRCSECDDTGTVVDTEGREYDCYACSKGLPDRIMKEPQ